MEAPQETAAEASENRAARRFLEEALGDPKPYTQQKTLKGKKGQFCAVKRWIQAAKEGKELNAKHREVCWRESRFATV